MMSLDQNELKQETQVSTVDSSELRAAPRKTTAAGSASILRHWQRTLFPPLILGVVFIGLWYFISYVILDEQRRFLLRPPHEVWLVGFADWGNFTEILAGLWSSTQVALIGLAVAILIGLSLATLMSQSELIERAVFPYAVTLQAIPILAIVPLIGFWFGFGVTARVIVCVIIALFPIIVNTLFGLLSAPRGLHDLFTLQRASRLTRLRKLMFPAALPAIFAGLRISAGLSVIGAIVGDFFFGRGDPGIGQLLQRYANRLLGEQLLAAIIMSSLLGVVVFQLFGWLQKWVIGAWHAERDADF
ncbi:MAG: ABC transporter permease [Caldilineaceae bacterium]|nr:ABC transporter permease [Caldilineaceae bacterium]